MGRREHVSGVVGWGGSRGRGAKMGERIQPPGPRAHRWSEVLDVLKAMPGDKEQHEEST